MGHEVKMKIKIGESAKSSDDHRKGTKDDIDVSVTKGQR